MFLVLFSYAFFFEGMTGLAITIGAVLTLFVLMQMTARVSWDDVFATPAGGVTRRRWGRAMRVAEADGTTVVHHATVTLDTASPLQIVDITPLVASVVRRAGLWDGLVCLATRHTTTGLLVNEHEPLLGDDLAAMFERLAGLGRLRPRRLHAAAGAAARERRNGHAHCRAALLRVGNVAGRRRRADPRALAASALRGMRRRPATTGVGGVSGPERADALAGVSIVAARDTVGLDG